MGHHLKQKYGVVEPNDGEVSERFKELVLKTSDSERGRGFESHPLRQTFHCEMDHGEVLKQAQEGGLLNR